MKVSVITLHRVRNFGSLLQTYATQTILNRLGHETEIIDYVPRGLTLMYGVLGIKRTDSAVKNGLRRAVAAITFSVQQIIVSRFLHANIAVGSKRYRSFEELEQMPPVADVYLSGSDQIWNTQNNNLPNDLRGYYLDFGPTCCRRVAYASSFGKTTFEAAEEHSIRQYLQHYQAIGVREDTAVRMIQKLGIHSVVHVLDPTLLLTADEWKSFIANKNPPRIPYIFVYNLNRNAALEALAQKLSREKNLKLINFSDTLQFLKGAQNKFFNTPYDFVNLIAHAEVVVTDSFHGTAFSINFSRQFVSFRAPRFNSRLESILRMMGLEDRLVSGSEEACRFVFTEIDYTEKSRLLEKQREKSFLFLQNALKKGDC